MLQYNYSTENKENRLIAVLPEKEGYYDVCSKNAGGYSIEEVKRNMLICQNIESRIKMGTVDEDIALEYLVLSCLK